MINLKQIKEILKENETDLQNLIKYIDFDDVFYKEKEFKNKEDFEEEVIDNFISATEITHYSNALKYLKENDPGLQESLEIAWDFGYTCDKVNSELLATLLLQSILQEELQELLNKIN